MMTKKNESIEYEDDVSAYESDWEEMYRLPITAHKARRKLFSMSNERARINILKKGKVPYRYVRVCTSVAKSVNEQLVELSTARLKFRDVCVLNHESFEHLVYREFVRFVRDPFMWTGVYLAGDRARLIREFPLSGSMLWKSLERLTIAMMNGEDAARTIDESSLKESENE